MPLGLGIVLIEAQISGLKCIVSKAIPKEAYITENIVSLGLDNPKEWANIIINTQIQDRKNVDNFKKALVSVKIAEKY